MIDLSGYRKPALQFSGGKDSLACLYLLRPLLADLIVYWLDTGDGCPETRAIVDQVRPWVPNFVTITTDVKAWRAIHGMPSDLAPARAHWLGVAYGMAASPIVGRFDCCWHNLMAPMHLRMVADGVDAVIRGTKLCDTGKVPIEGRTEFYDVLLPLRDWTHGDVFDYLESVGAPRNGIYEHAGQGISAPECMGCTAWWEDGKAAYFKALHPQRLEAYRNDLRRIRVVVQEHLRELDEQLEG